MAKMTERQLARARRDAQENVQRARLNVRLRLQDVRDARRTGNIYSIDGAEETLRNARSQLRQAQNAARRKSNGGMGG